MSSLMLRILFSLGLLHACLMTTPQGCVPSEGSECATLEDETSLMQNHVSVSKVKREAEARPLVEMVQEVAKDVKPTDDAKKSDVKKKTDASDDKAKTDDKKKADASDDSKKSDDKKKTDASTASTAKPTYLPPDKFGAGAKVTKIKLNSAGDLPLFIGAIRVDIGGFFFMCFAFCFLHRWYPEMFAIRSAMGYMDDKENPETRTEEWLAAEWTDEDIKSMPKWKDGKDAEGNDREVEPQQIFKKKNNFPAPKSARFNPEDGYFWPWWNAQRSLDLWSDQMVQCIGLDAAMLLIFTEMAMNILIKVGAPLVIIGAPIFMFGGGGAAKHDLLSWQGVGNVLTMENTPSGDGVEGVQWVFWYMAFATWYVVINVQSEMFTYQERFIERRKHWLRGQPAPQSRTALVELLPLPPPPLDPQAAGAQSPETTGQEYWDDEYLKKYFNKLYPDQIESAYVVKKASELIGLVDNYADIACGLNEDHKDNEDLVAVRTKIKDAQDSLKKRKEESHQNPTAYYSVNGFVTFKQNEQRDAALNQRISDTDGEFEMTAPPLPQDVLYADLETDEDERTKSDALGLALIVGLFFAFMPIVLAISKVTSIATIEQVPMIKSILHSSGYETTIGGVLASMGLTFMMSFLPTFLMMIFGCFCMKSQLWKQHELQKWYFWFLVTFVLLITAVGSNLSETLETLAERPFSIFTLLANRMPLTTHFYLNYSVMQPLTHGMNLTRYISLIKYFIFKNACGYGRDGGGASEDARFKVEPEDQDYYGIGSRSARFAFMLLVGLVFGTICPLMNLVVFFNFWVCRLVYGYLITSCESRKNDMGGDCWVQQIKHISQSMLIYIILQVGIIAHRAESAKPAGVAAVAFFYWFQSYMKLRAKHWDRLSLGDVMMPTEEKVKLRLSERNEYSQDLDTVYLVPYESKGEDVWVKHFKK